MVKEHWKKKTLFILWNFHQWKIDNEYFPPHIRHQIFKQELFFIQGLRIIYQRKVVSFNSIAINKIFPFPCHQRHKWYQKNEWIDNWSHSICSLHQDLAWPQNTLSCVCPIVLNGARLLQHTMTDKFSKKKKSWYYLVFVNRNKYKKK